VGIEEYDFMIRIDEEQDCPTKDFNTGEPSGQCWGDGHYLCSGCKYFRADFKSDSGLRERLLEGQTGNWRIFTLQPLPGISV